MYSVSDYGWMIANKPRTDAYAEALRRAVKPGSVVLDIGAGTGIWSVLACQFGARHVYAIEPDDAIQVAREIAAANGLAERITFIQDFSTRVTLPEPAEVMISDLHGVLPLFQKHIRSIVDARRRLLAPGGTLIPRVDTLWAAIVQAPEEYQRLADPWDGNEYGLDMQAGRRIVANSWRKKIFKEDQLIVKPQIWGALDYATIENPDLSGELAWTISQAGMAHGLGLWFDATLAEGVTFSNAPGLPELIYGNAFFPWSAPVALAIGDRVSVKINADLVGDDYIWRWEALVLEQGDPARLKADFKQSTFYGAPLSPVRLRRQAANHVPRLGAAGEIDRFILAAMDAQSSVGDIARRLLAEFPAHFASFKDALTQVGEISCKYGL